MVTMLTTSADIQRTGQVLSQESVSEKAEEERKRAPYLKLKICRQAGFLSWD
jgi:hypothetical protein